MKFTLEINMDNTAFECPDIELSKIFTELKERMLNGGGDLYPGDKDSIRDSNGNKVGTWEVTE